MGIRITDQSQINYEDYDVSGIMHDDGVGTTLISLPIIDGQRFDSYSVDIEAGRIFSTKSGRFLQNKPNANGYVYACLTSSTVRKQKAMGLSNIIMSAYLGIDPSDWIEQGYEVNFADGNRENCSIFNLVLKSGKQDDHEYLLGSSTSHFNVATGDITMRLLDEDEEQCDWEKIIEIFAETSDSMLDSIKTFNDDMEMIEQQEADREVIDTDGIRLNTDWQEDTDDRHISLGDLGYTNDTQGIDTLTALVSILDQFDAVVKREALRREIFDELIEDYDALLSLGKND